MFLACVTTSNGKDRYLTSENKPPVMLPSNFNQMGQNSILEAEKMNHGEHRHKW